MKRVYPQYPSYADLLHDLLREVDTGVCNAENDLFPLTQFALEYERLCIIGVLLPDLIKLYQWIHTELVRHRVKWTYADTHTVEHVLGQIDEKDSIYDTVTGKEWYSVHTYVCTCTAYQF